MSTQIFETPIPPPFTHYPNLEILDIALDYLHEMLSEKRGWFGKDIFRKYMTETRGIDLFDPEIILDKLLRDGYIEMSENTIKISFDGKTFQEAGGYRTDAKLLDARIKNEEARIKKEDDFQLNSENNQKRLNNLTRWLAIGTSALAVIEIIRLSLRK